MYKKTKAFTLIEVLLALAILGIVLVVMIPFLASGVKGIMESGEKSADVFQNQALLETQVNDVSVIPEDLANTTFLFSNTTGTKTMTIENSVKYEQASLVYITVKK